MDRCFASVASPFIMKGPFQQTILFKPGGFLKRNSKKYSPSYVLCNWKKDFIQRYQKRAELLLFVRSRIMMAELTLMHNVSFLSTRSNSFVYVKIILKIIKKIISYCLLIL
ncbi:hypothetical protein Dimus_025587 [Dionaea muscipula]